MRYKLIELLLNLLLPDDVKSTVQNIIKIYQTESTNLLAELTNDEEITIDELKEQIKDIFNL